ncbi:uncharacterized protein FFFS_15784 [Fusarium fujikuroi]|nr:uncharacterized protein FFFS_15784 [Fusarium fujikuroi]
MAIRREISVALEDEEPKSIWDRIEAESQEGSGGMNPTMEKFLSRWREKPAASEDMAKLASVCKGQATPREPTNDIAVIIDRLGEADSEGQMERVEHCHNETVEAPVDMLDASDNMSGYSERPALPGTPWPQQIEERAFIPQYHSPEKLCHMASSVAPVFTAEEPYQIKRWLVRERRREKFEKNERNKEASKNHFGGIEYHRDGAAKTNDIDHTVGKATQAMGAIQPMKIAAIDATEHFLGRTRFPIDLPRPTPVSLPPISQLIPSSALPSGIPVGSSEILTPLPKQVAIILTPDDTGRRDASGRSEVKTVVNVPSIIHPLAMTNFLQSGCLEARAQLKNEPRRVWTAEADLRRFHYSDKETSPTAGKFIQWSEPRKDIQRLAEVNTHPYASRIHDIQCWDMAER